MRQVQFSGNLPEAYESSLRPLLFDPYAEWLAARLELSEVEHILELAAGTGALTKALHDKLPQGAVLVATDIQEGMLEIAKGKLAPTDNLAYEVADALDLPFGDNSFDLVVVQFGWMFFPDKVRGASEMFRVLRSGGRLAMLVWNSIEQNEFALVAKGAIAQFFEDGPPKGFDVPWGFGDRDRIQEELKSAGFEDLHFEDVELTGSSTPEGAAHGITRGTPMALEIMERAPDRHDEIEAAVANALRTRFAADQFEAHLSALFVNAKKPN